MSLDIMPAAPPAVPSGNSAVATGPPGSSAGSAAGSGSSVLGKNVLFALMLASQTEAAGPVPTKTANSKTPTTDVPSNAKENHTSSKEDAVASDADGKVTQEPAQTLNEMIAAGLQALPVPNAATQALPTSTMSVSLKSGSNSAANGQNVITKTTAADAAVLGQKTLDAMDTRSSATSLASTVQGSGNDSGSLSENAQASAETLQLPQGTTPSSPPSSVDAVSKSMGALTSSPSPVPAASLLPTAARVHSAPVTSASSVSVPAKTASPAQTSLPDASQVAPEQTTAKPAMLSAATTTADATPVADPPSEPSQKAVTAAQPQGVSAAPITSVGTNTQPTQALPPATPITQTPQLGAITPQPALQNTAVPANNTSKQTASAEGVSINGKTANAAKTTTSRTSSGKSIVNAASPAMTAKSAVIAAPSGAADERGDGSSGSPNAKSQHKTAADLAVSAGTTDTQSAKTDSSVSMPSVSATGVEKQSAVTVGATAPLTGAERAQVIRQAAEAVTQLQPVVKSTGTSQMTLNLHPQEWGKLQVSVQMTTASAADGTTSTGVVAHIVASDPAVKSALELHTTDLHQALAEAGLKLDRLSVTVQATNATAKSDLSGSGQSFGQSMGQNDAQSRQTPDAQQAALSGNSAGATTFGGSSSFSGYFEGRGERTGQGQAQSRSVGPGEGSDLEMAPAISIRSIAAVRGSFDGRA